MTLGEALKARRAELDVSQERAAVALGTTSNSYAKWENSEDYPRTFKWVPPLADWLAMDSTDVFLLILEAQESASLGTPNLGVAPAGRTQGGPDLAAPRTRRKRQMGGYLVPAA